MTDGETRIVMVRALYRRNGGTGSHPSHLEVSNSAFTIFISRVFTSFDHASCFQRYKSMWRNKSFNFIVVAAGSVPVQKKTLQCPTWLFLLPFL